MLTSKLCAMDGARKMQRKNERRRKKCEHIVAKETGAVCSDVATKNIAICNAGLVNGLSQETIAENFLIYGPIDRITMLPGKSCCFVAFKDIQSAENAYNNAHGKLNLAQDNKPIYLMFVETVPEENLFAISSENPPPGLIILENFISVEEENLLLSLNEFDGESTMKHRKVKHYGYEFRYDTNNVDKDKPLEQKIPGECDFLWERLKTTRPAFADFNPDQLTINHYSSGQGIPPHVDTHSAFEDPIISLSLADSVVMEFKNTQNQHKSIYLPQRSLLIMSGESRYNWTHGITPRKFDLITTETGLSVRKRATRISFTFRRVRNDECRCEFVEMCDSYKIRGGIIDGVLAAKLEDQHVHAVYQNVAGHFSETRSKPWPNVLHFVQSLKVGDVLVDVGCGNGKYLGENLNIFAIGCDRSANLLSICKSRKFEVFSCDCLAVPFKNESADAVISIAVIHHLANEERRLNAIKEIVRILRIHGQALIYVWAKDQFKNNEKSSYLKQDRKNRKEVQCVSNEAKTEVLLDEKINLPVHTNRKQFQHQDVLVPWKLKNGNSVDNTFLRYYHVFEENELENLCKKVQGVQICNSYYDQGNWCVLIKKVIS